jgi:hypothetical protein
MSEFYSKIKILHIACVVCTGVIFTFRGVLMWAESRWTNALALRRLPTRLTRCYSALPSLWPESWLVRRFNPSFGNVRCTGGRFPALKYSHTQRTKLSAAAAQIMANPAALGLR